VPAVEPEEVTVPEPIAQPASYEAPTAGDCSLVYNYDWDTTTALAVCLAESGGNPNAFNGNDVHNGCVGSIGLFQIACLHEGASFDPATNVETAYRLYNRSGWTIWGAYTSGSYLKFM